MRTIDPLVSPYAEAYRVITRLRERACSLRAQAERTAQLLEAGLEDDEIWDYRDPHHLFRIADRFEPDACRLERAEVAHRLKL